MSRPTSITATEVRADMLIELLLDGRALVREDIARLPGVRCWSAAALGAAIDVAVADGRLADDGYGRLIVRREA